MRSLPVVLALCACGSTPPEVVAPVADAPVIPQADDVRVAFFDSQAHNDLTLAVPVACVTQDGTVLGNEACAPKLYGQQATLPAGHAVLEGVTTVTCESTGTKALALVATVSEPLEWPATWGYLGQGLPNGWHLASRSQVGDDVVSAALSTLAGSGWPLSPGAVDVQLDERLDLEGTRVLEAFAPSEDPDKPGHSALFLAGSDILPLPTTGLSLNGRVRTPGAFPVRNNGHVLILTSEWMGGSGVHAVHLSHDGPVTIGEWACGS